MKALDLKLLNEGNTALRIKLKHRFRDVRIRYVNKVRAYGAELNKGFCLKSGTVCKNKYLIGNFRKLFLNHA